VKGCSRGQEVDFLIIQEKRGEEFMLLVQEGGGGEYWCWVVGGVGWGGDVMATLSLKSEKKRNVLLGGTIVKKNVGTDGVSLFDPREEGKDVSLMTEGVQVMDQGSLEKEIGEDLLKNEPGKNRRRLPWRYALGGGDRPGCQKKSDVGK